MAIGYNKVWHLMVVKVRHKQKFKHSTITCGFLWGELWTFELKTTQNNQKTTQKKVQYLAFVIQTVPQNVAIFSQVLKM